MSVSLSHIIADHIVNSRFEQLSAKAVLMTKYSLLDAIGVMLGASGIGEGCDAFVQLALEANATPEATILGYGARTSASLAAFANGALAHALDFEDAHDLAPVHPNAQTIPAALALAESLNNVSGPELITALAVGCDLVCRLGMCLTTNIDDYGWYPPPILGALGATATAVKLLRLNEQQTLDALSLTLCQSSCSAEIKYSPQSVVRSIRDAFASQAGVVSAQLAYKGARGFDKPLEGKAGFFNNFARGNYDGDVLTNELGQRFEGENVSFKPWPSCRGTHAYIDAALQLMKQHQLKSIDIANAQMMGHKVQSMLYEPLAQKQEPATAIDAKFSLPFTVATALCHSEVTLKSYRPAALKDSAVLDLAKRITFKISKDPNASDNATRGSLTLVTKSGLSHSLSIEHPLGHALRPMNESALVAKFTQCSQLAKQPLTITKTDQLVKAILILEMRPLLDDHFFELLQSGIYLS